MGDAFEALADIRRWACETLDSSDAGKLCGMLSEMSRHANGLESQNAKLRELVRDLYGCGDSCTHCKYWNQGDGFYCDLGVGWKARRMKELGIWGDDE